MQMSAPLRFGALALLILTLLAPAAMAADVEYVKTLVVTPMPELPSLYSFWNGKHFFVRSGSCSGSTPGYWGLWVFDESGTLTGTRDVAWDTGNFDCWQHTWQLGLQMSRVDDNGVILSNGRSFRTPVYYTIRGGKIEMVSRANQNPPWTTCTGCHPGADESTLVDTIAVTQNGYVVGRKQTASGMTTTVFRLPTFQEVGTGPDMNGGVIGAIGNYVIGWTVTGTGTGRVTQGVVYRMGNNGQLTFVKNIPPLASEYGVLVDQWNPYRGLLHGTVRENGVTKEYWKIYEATPTDLVEKYSKELPIANTGVSNPKPVGLAGEHIAVIAYRQPANPGTAALWESRPIELWKTTGSEKLILQAPPGVVTTQGQPAQPAMGGLGVGISKTGKVVVATHHAAYLYQIRDFTVDEEEQAPTDVCGDGIKSQAEQCDLGDATRGSGNGACPKTCSAACTTNTCSSATYAPAIDPINGQTYLSIDAKAIGDTITLEIDAGTTGRYIYRKGYSLDAAGAWTPFTFPQAPIGGTSWILDSASTTLTDVPAEGAVIIYSCMRYTPDGPFVCGPTSDPPDTTQPAWTLATYDVAVPSSPGDAPPSYGWVAS